MGIVCGLYTGMTLDNFSSCVEFGSGDGGGKVDFSPLDVVSF